MSDTKLKDKVFNCEVIRLRRTHFNLKELGNLVGLVFKNENDVLNIPFDEEDILKSMQYFDNYPRDIFFVEKTDTNDIGEDELHYSKEWKQLHKHKYRNNQDSCMRIVASTNLEINKELDIPCIPKDFLQLYVEHKGKIDQVQFKVLMSFEKSDIKLHLQFIEGKKQKQTFSREEVKDACKQALYDYIVNGYEFQGTDFAMGLASEINKAKQANIDNWFDKKF